MNHMMKLDRLLLLVSLGAVESKLWDPSLRKENHEISRNHRSLQVFSGSAFCRQVEGAPNQYQTVRHNIFVGWLLSVLGQAGEPGTCGQVCDMVCDHSPCAPDFNAIDSELCTCIPGAPSPCGTNTYCGPNEVCLCSPGFQGDPLNVCEDINECNANVCGGGGTCVNTIGSYTCECEAGYIYADGSCQDVDECVTQTAPCGPQASCTNTQGSFLCECDIGYEGNPPTSACTDKNECLLNPCGDRGTCTNIAGAWNCDCNSGYRNTDILGGGCEDINECTESNPCGPNSVCQNLEGSFNCACQIGYEPATTTTCVDVDECLSSPCGENEVCTNTAGSFECTCADGYAGTAGGCSDVDECADPNACAEDQMCINQVGSFRCECDEGYLTTVAGDCVDKDECATGDPCGPLAACENTEGSFTCTCNEEFPGGTAPDCRKLVEFEMCSSNIGCTAGLSCSFTSLSDQDTTTCCSETTRCLGTNQCCVGVYEEGDECPSGNDLDCRGDLQCGRQGVLDPTLVCCQNTTPGSFGAGVCF